MAVKLELYKVFKEVAEAGNITAAAQALYISQSAVSQSIKQLEGDLQTRLFARNSRGVTLTADGKLLYEYVRSAIGLLETGEAKLSQTRELQMEKAFAAGVNRNIDPFMTLSFMALPVIPTLRITTRGVFDVTTQRYI